MPQVHRRALCERLWLGCLAQEYLGNDLTVFWHLPPRPEHFQPQCFSAQSPNRPSGLRLSIVLEFEAAVTRAGLGRNQAVGWHAGIG